MLTPFTHLDLSKEAWAHGTRLEYQAEVTINLQARYDNNEPMSGGQVSVFAPGELSEPWMQTYCDEEGFFSFTPDMMRPGLWEVHINHDGHGAVINIPVGDDMPLSGSSSSVTKLQKAIMIGSVLWGFLGTALYFSRRKSGPLPQGGHKDAHT
ncbi:carboxypeptidase regulatory-like domain-containing protein [Heliorestis acidaminivorans]|uniref:Carboxypeptidase regulatory-like domain-containing protein n=1 Tax=Heliorestis acidaminivorans TaxID=553427 RepID=A0A6I0F1N1_9FIRM|nr:carboxypeptidase regulatory-like domain-containing protein [Heliorestis acidaminivorans]KAB2952119.1 carboxypeptidase regulatory-like domain-containing protein [Heliorestis acidaminivorans]